MYQVNYYNSAPEAFFNNDSKAMVGYLRADFGQNGYEFYSTFFNKNDDLITDEFRKEFNEVVNTLRATILRDRYSLRSTMTQNPNCKIDTDTGTSSGVFVETEKFEYAVRLIGDSGNYDFYIHCYDKSLLEPEYTNSKEIKEENTITLGKLLSGITFEDIHLTHADEDIELATICELNKDMFTEEGKKDWADVLNARVNRIFEGAYGVQLECSGIDAQRLSGFSYMLAGHVSSEDFDRWIKSDEEQGLDMNI